MDPRFREDDGAEGRDKSWILHDAHNDGEQNHPRG